MLNFWKRSGQKEKAGSTSSLFKNSVVNTSLDNESSDKLTLNHFDCSGILSALDDEGLCDIGDADTGLQQSSRLSKTLSEVLTDKSALGYLIQYLESEGSVAYVRCWIDIENCRSALHSVDTMYVQTLSRDQLEENIDVRLLSPLPSLRLDHDSLSVSTDCDSFTADTNSLFDFSSNMTELRSSAIDIHVCPTKIQRNESLKQDNVHVYCDKDASDNSCRPHKLDTEPDLLRDKPAKALLENALRIFKKYIAQEAPHSITCPDDMRNDIIEAICSEAGLLTASFDKIQKYVFDVLDSKYFNGYLRSHYHCKYQIDVLTSGNITLSDILYNESILFYFMEFLEQEDAGVLLEFWFAATNFRQQLENRPKSDYNAEEAQNDALVLYNKYFSLQATNPLGFGDRIRFLIEENICRESGPLPECFHQPVRLVEYALDKNYLKTFLSSQLYFKYLSELICTVQTNGCPSSVAKSRASSDCSSEISNTLLAMEDTAHLKRRTLRATSKADMNIDTRQLYDPDSLWKRRKARRLSFGRITDLGRFETDVEPEPDRRSRSRFTRAVRKLINMEENKTKEEMAWQVAEMIVKDITSVTLADPPTSTHS